MTDALGNKAFKAGIWYTVSTISVKAITILTTPIFTRLLSTADYGISATFTSWYSIMFIICSLNMDMSVGRAKQDFKNCFEHYIGSLQLLSIIFSGSILSIGIVFLEVLSDFTELNQGLIVVLFIYLLFSPSVSLAQTKFRYEYRYKENIGIMLYTTVSTVLFSLILILYMDQDKYWGKVIGTVIPTVLLGLYFIICGIHKRILCINKEFWSYALNISVPMIIHSLSLNTLAMSDRVIIMKYVGAEATGIYTLAYQYAILINIIMGAVNQAWQPWFHDNLYAGKKILIRDRVKDITLLGGFIGLGCVALAPEMIALLGPDEYHSGVHVLPPLVMGIICQFVYTNYINIELHLKKTKYASVGTIIAAIINILLNLIFVPKYGFVAAAYTTLISYILLLYIHYFITKYILNMTVYDNIFFVKFLSGVAGVCLLCSHMFNNFLARLIIIFVLGIWFLYRNRKICYRLINKRNI